MSVMLRRVRVSSSRPRSTRRRSSHRCGGTPAVATKTALRCDGDRPTSDASSRRPTSDPMSASIRSVTRRTRQSHARLIKVRPGVRSSRSFARKSATPSVTTALSAAKRQARLPADASFQRWLSKALTLRSSAWPACRIPRSTWSTSASRLRRPSAAGAAPARTRGTHGDRAP